MEDSSEAVKSLQAKDGVFDFKDGPSFALSYLRTYYMQPVTADETAVWEFLADDFGKKPPRGRFIELGCGPTGIIFCLSLHT